MKQPPLPRRPGRAGGGLRRQGTSILRTHTGGGGSTHRAHRRLAVARRVHVLGRNDPGRPGGDVLIAIMAQAIPVLAAEDVAFSSLQERAERVRELFDELPERQIQQSDLERVGAALVD